MMLDDIIVYLQAQSTADFVDATNLFGSKLPDQPNTCTAVYIQSGTQPQWTFGSTAPIYESPRLQVITRSTSYAAAHTRAQLANTILDNYHNSSPSTSGPRYIRIRAAQSPFDVGEDGAQRTVVSQNFIIEKER